MVRDYRAQPLTNSELRSIWMIRSHLTSWGHDLSDFTDEAVADAVLNFGDFIANQVTEDTVAGLESMRDASR